RCQQPPHTPPHQPSTEASPLCRESFRWPIYTAAHPSPRSAALTLSISRIRPAKTPAAATDAEHCARSGPPPMSQLQAQTPLPPEAPHWSTESSFQSADGRRHSSPTAVIQFLLPRLIRQQPKKISQQQHR